MFTKLQKSIGMALVVGLTPVMLAATPILAQGQPTTDVQQTQTVTTTAPTQAQPGTDFSTASAPIAGWVQIAPNGTQWYKFKYDYDNSDSDNTPTQAVVKLQMEQVNSLGFTVWTPGSMRNLVHDDRDKDDHSNDRPQPVGHGTPLIKGTVHESDITDGPYTNKDKGEAITDAQTLVWVGGAQASDTYYIVVKNNTNAPVNYKISITGPSVSF